MEVTLLVEGFEADDDLGEDLGGLGVGQRVEGQETEDDRGQTSRTEPTHEQHRGTIETGPEQGQGHRRHPQQRQGQQVRAIIVAILPDGPRHEVLPGVFPDLVDLIFVLLVAKLRLGLRGLFLFVRIFFGIDGRQAVVRHNRRSEK